MKLASLPAGLALDLMTDVELDTLRKWALAEGWNPGISDMAISTSFDLTDVFRRAKMVMGEQPKLRADRVFGLTSFEFG